ncbi:MAG: cytochrome P450 [Chlamydiales bacterium]|nr:cytochrome P450 [Chlamydiales bacterium]
MFYNFDMINSFPVIQPVAEAVVSPIMSLAEQTAPWMNLVVRFPTSSVLGVAIGCAAFSRITKILKRTGSFMPKGPQVEPTNFTITDVNQAKRILRRHRGDVVIKKLPVGYHKDEFVFTCSEEKTSRFRRVFNRIFVAIKDQLIPRAHLLARDYINGDIKYEEYSIQGVMTLLGTDGRSFYKELQHQGLPINEAKLTTKASLEPARQIYAVIRRAIIELSKNSSLANEIRDEIQISADGGQSLALAIQENKKLRNVCMEALRFSVPIHIERKGYSAEGEIVRGQHICPQDDVTIDSIYFAYDPKLVGPSPEKFRPNRWIDASDHWPSLPFMPFGANRHRCPAWQLVVTQVLQMVGTLVYEQQIVFDNPL